MSVSSIIFFEAFSCSFRRHLHMCNLDIYLARPGMLDLKGKAKWDSWESKKSMSCEAAKDAYVAKAAELVAKYGA